MFWPFMGRNAKIRRSRGEDDNDGFLMLHSPIEATSPPPPPSPSKTALSNWLDDNLARQTPDSTIIATMNSLNQHIQTYVETHINVLKIPRMELPDLLAVKAGVERALGNYVDSDFQMGIKEFSGLLIGARTRRAAVRYLVAWVLLSGISGFGDETRSLLPGELVGFMNRIPEPTADWQLFQEALCKWRLLSRFLLLPSSNSTAKAQNSRREQELRSNIQRITTRLNDTLKSFYNTHPNVTAQSRDKDLASLIRKTADFGLLLFSQPIPWFVQWEDATAQLGPMDEDEGAASGGRPRDLVIFPGLEKTDVEERTGRFKRRPVKMVVAEVDRNVQIGPSFRIPSIRVGLAA